jgi:inhibitor of cysteine peptidase
MYVIKEYALLATIVCFVSCGGYSNAGINLTETYAMSDAVIDKDKGGREFEVDPNDKVIIRLPENPTTGYRWELESFDSGILAPTGSDFLTTGSSSMGAGGMRTFTFRAHSPGTTSVRLILRRSWEPKQKAIEHFDVTIQVRKKRP